MNLDKKISLLKNESLKISSGNSRSHSNFFTSQSTGERGPTQYWTIDSISTQSSRGSFEKNYKSKSPSRQHDNNCIRKFSVVQIDESLVYPEKRSSHHRSTSRPTSRHA